METHDFGLRDLNIARLVFWWSVGRRLLPKKGARSLFVDEFADNRPHSLGKQVAVAQTKGVGLAE
jgi:hypothetical protein